MAELQPPDPDDDRAYVETMARRDRTLAVLVVVIGVVVLAFSWSPLSRALPTDSPGYYVIGDVPDCRAKTYCRSRTGTFTSDDRKVINKSTSMNNQLPTSVRKGDSVRAFDIGADAVYLLTRPRSFKYEWQFTGTVLGLVAIASGAYWFWRNRERPSAKGPGAIEVTEHEPPTNKSRNRARDRGPRARRRRRRQRARTDPAN